MTEVSEIKNHFEELQNNVDERLPKVDSDLMCDLLTRQQENHTPMYMLDVFTKPDIDFWGITRQDWLLQCMAIEPIM